MKKDAIPSTTMMSPTTSSAFIDPSLNAAFSIPLCLGHESILPEFAGELDQAAHRYSRRTLCDPRLVLFHPRGAGDIEMDPRRCFREFPQERGGSACASPASAGVHQVSDARTRHVEILIIDWQTPHVFTRLRQSSSEPLIEGFVVGKDSDVRISQGHDNG